MFIIYYISDNPDFTHIEITDKNSGKRALFKNPNICRIANFVDSTVTFQFCSSMHFNFDNKEYAIFKGLKDKSLTVRLIKNGNPISNSPKIIEKSSIK